VRIMSCHVQHHCRACGGVFCWYCTETRIKLIVVGSLTEQLVRICDMCAKKGIYHSQPPCPLIYFRCYLSIN
jgi:hypothetical protein